MTAGHTPRPTLRTRDGKSKGFGDSDDNDDSDDENSDDEEQGGGKKGKTGDDGVGGGTFEDLTKLLNLWVEIHGNHPYNTKCLELSSAIPHTEWLRVIKLVQVQ
jgi:hypothetical protein